MASKKTADQVFVRELNLSLVLRYIHNEAPVSRAQIAVATGLNKSTVSSLVEDLIGRQLIHETGINPGSPGRPATFLEINPQAGSIIGVEFGVDFVAVALTDFARTILWRETVNTSPAETQYKMIAQTLSLAHRAMTVSRERNFDMLGIGLAAPGPVDLNEGLLVYAPNLQWKNVPLRQIFSESTGLKVFVENDANAAAIGEHLFGTARNDTDFVLVYIGVGIGGGLFLNGKLYRGKNGYAGEIGHSPILGEPVQSPCHCGNFGCWEAYANQHKIIQNVYSSLDTNHDGIIRRLMDEQTSPLTIAILKQAADAGDSLALDTLSNAGEVIGQGIASLINIFNPEKIILGGPLSIAEKYLLPSIKSAISEFVYPVTNHNLEIGFSNFGSDVSLIGAIAIVVEDILSNPSNIERR